MENQQRRHQLDLVRVEGGRYLKYVNRCRVCQWSWPTRRRSACPGVPRYAYGAWPPTLHPAGELKRLGREIPPSPDGCAYRLWEPHWLWLYDERVAPPAPPPPPPKTFGARVRAFFLGEEAGKAICQVCGYEPADDRSADLVDGLCRTCHFQRAWRQKVQDIRHWAQRVLLDEGAILLDTQTTGLGERDVVIELALLSASEGVPLYNTLIRPNRPIPWAATLRHSLMDADVRSAPTFGEIWADLLPILERYQRVISYNAAYHRGRLDWTAQVYGFRLPPLKWDCLMTRYAEFYGQLRNGDAANPYRWQTLRNACMQQKTHAGRSPRALSQVKRARRLLVAIAEQEGEHWDATR
jgi:DNA polymerase III subunit epsilon